MWTELPCKNFHLLLCCAILESEKQQIMEKHYGFNEILKVVIPLILDFNILVLFSFWCCSCTKHFLEALSNPLCNLSFINNN